MSLEFNIDLHFFGISNFLNGNFNGTYPDIISNLQVNFEAINNSYFFLVLDDLPHPESNYGKNISKTGLYYGSQAVNSIASSTNDIVLINEIAPFGNEFLPITKLSKGMGEHVVNNGKLLNNNSSIGDGLLQAVSSALFKKVGKNAAILNDTQLVNNLNNDFYNLINAQVSEINKNYEESSFFPLYYDSGRYNNDSINLTGDTDYNLNNTIINMNLNLSGSVNDLDGDILFNQNIEHIHSVFGTYNINHKISTNEPIGIYNLKLFISLKHDDRF